jgi:uncharacterized protein (TIGR02598 family)
VLGQRRKAGFSLIEVSMALAIVAIAFVALIGLLPAGMKVFEAAANTTAETRIVSHLSSMLQAADYKNFKEGSYSGVTYYYDVDGSYVDSSADAVTGSEPNRVYAARLIIGKQNIPNAGGDYDTIKTSTKVIVVMGRNDPVVTATMTTVNSASDVGQLKGDSRLKAQPILVTRMDLEPQ